MAEAAGSPGYALFVVNDGSNGDAFRGAPGTDADMDHFRSIFEEGLGFEWKNDQYLNRNLTLAQWDHTKVAGVNRAARGDQCCLICRLKMLDFTGKEYLVVGISTHGADVEGSAVVQLFDGSFMHVDDIIAALSDRKFPQLMGVKRIIVINSCRIDHYKPEGVAQDRGLSIGVVSDAHGVQPSDSMETHMHTQPLAKGKSYEQKKPPPRLHSLERQHSRGYHNRTQLMDYLLVYAAAPGRLALTNNRKGSWMLHALNEVVSTHDFSHRPLNFLQAITKANGIMSQRESISHNPDGSINPLETGLKNSIFFSSTLLSLPLFNGPVREAGPELPQPDMPGNQDRNNQTQPKMI